MKKIAIVTYALQVGGVESVIRLSCDFFKKQGHNVTIIETFTKGRWSDTFSKAGYQIRQLLPKFYESRISQAKKLAKVLSDFDIVILHDAAFAQATLGLLPDETVAVPVLHLNITSMLRNATANSNNWDVLSAVSPALQKYAIMFGAAKEKVKCIPNGIVVQGKWPKSDTAFSQDLPLRVVYIGAINHRQKGVLHLPHIFADVTQKHPSIQFDIIGDGPELNQLKARFENINRINLTFHGALPNPDAMLILSKADVLIMPSYFEGLPIVLLEAIASGVVPVVSRLTGITDFIIKDNFDGFLVNSGDEKGFSDAIIKLSEDRKILLEMSKAAWQNALSRFSYAVMGAAYLSLAEELRKQRIEKKSTRNHKIDISLLGDYPYLPVVLVRPARKILRMLGLHKDKAPEPFLYEPE